MLQGIGPKFFEATGKQTFTFILGFLLIDLLPFLHNYM